MTGPLVDFTDRDALTAAIRTRADLLALAQEATGNRMRRAGAEWRGPCPLHQGEGPNFAVNPSSGLYKCFTCDAGGDVFDFVRAWQALDFPSARQWLGDRAEVSLSDVSSPRSVITTITVPPPRRSSTEIRRDELLASLEELRAEGCMPSPPRTVYASVLALLSLGPVGAAYLARRGFNPDAAAHYGFRSVDSAVAWGALRHELEEGFLAAEVELAGLTSFPWQGDRPALVIPYRAGRDVIGLRFRSLVPDAGHTERYRSLPGVPLPLPFNADALTLGTGPLHLVEGELNAYTLATYGLRAIGLPGATTWRSEWAAMIASAVGSSGLLVAWYDDDDAGAKARAALARRLQDSLGAGWLARHGVSAILSGDDANGLHSAGTLRPILERAGVL